MSKQKVPESFPFSSKNAYFHSSEKKIRGFFVMGSQAKKWIFSRSLKFLIFNAFHVAHNNNNPKHLQEQLEYFYRRASLIHYSSRIERVNV